MKKLIGIVCLSAIAVAGSVYADEVSFRAVNPVIQSLVDAVVSADEFVDFAYPRFDESYCDLKTEKIKYDLQGSMKNTPWLEGGKADVIGSSTYAVDHAFGHTGVAVTMAATIRTDTLALVRYSAYLVLKKSDFSDPKFGARLQAHFKRLAVATSLEQVYELAISGQQLAKDVIQNEIDREEARLRCMQAGTCTIYGNVAEQIADQKATIAEWKATLPSHDKTQVTPVREGNHIRQLIFSSPEVAGYSPPGVQAGSDYVLVVGKASVTMDDSSLSSNVGSFYKLDQKGLADLKSGFEKRLSGVQNGVSQDKDDTQQMFRRALIRFKQVIKGES